MDDQLMEIIRSSERLYDGAILNLERLTVTLPNGKAAFREVVRHIGAAAVVPVDQDGYVYLVQQFRAPVGCVMLELPAGKLDFAGEDRAQTARRELLEETGLTAARWTHLSDIATTPGFSDEIIGLYLAEGLSRGEASPDEDEFLHVVKMPFAEALDKVLCGEINDAKTICGLLLAQRVLGL